VHERYEWQTMAGEIVAIVPLSVRAAQQGERMNERLRTQIPLSVPEKKQARLRRWAAYRRSLAPIDARISNCRELQV